MILHCNSVSDGPQAGTAIVSFKILQPEAPPATPADKPKPTQYPGFAVIGGFNVTLASADAAAFNRGSQYSIVPK